MSIFNQLTNANNKRFNLVLCELHYTPIHGKTETSCSTIEGHYLLIDKFAGNTGILLEDQDDEYDTDNETDEEDVEENNSITHMYHIQQLYEREYALTVRQVPHKLIRNYHNIISRTNYIKP